MTTANSPRFGIVIPIYNTAPYIAECIRSLKAQQYKDFLAVCVDDGSTDGSHEALNEAVAGDERFLILENPHLGVSAARNRALEEIKQRRLDYVAFLDSDDIVEPTWLSDYAVAIQAAMKVGVALDYGVCGAKKLLRTGYQQVYQDCAQHALGRDEAIREFVKTDEAFNFRTNQTSFLGGKVFRLAALGDVYFQSPVDGVEDQAFVLEMLLRIERGVMLEQQNYIYRRRRSSLSMEHAHNTQLGWLYLKFTQRLPCTGSLARGVFTRTHELWWAQMRTLSMQKSPFYAEWARFGLALENLGRSTSMNMQQRKRHLLNRLHLLRGFLALKRRFGDGDYRIDRISEPLNEDALFP